MKLKTILRMLLILSVSSSLGQSTIQYYEELDEGNRKFYYNKYLKYTEKSCADFTRYSKVIDDELLHGQFTDKYLDSIVVMKGTYIAGLKNGYFQGFYNNGVPKFRGVFKLDKPSGKWQYYYPNGELEREIHYTENDTLLFTKNDLLGNPTVEEGEGFFDGVTTILIGDGTVMRAQGKIVNGKMDGKWKVYSEEKLFLVENFKKNEFKSGRMMTPNSEYSDSSWIGKFFLNRDIIELEKFSKQRCELYYLRIKRENAIYPYKKSSPFVMQLYNFFRSPDIISVEIESPSEKIYYLKVKFDVLKSGKPANIKMASSWGISIFPKVKALIEEGRFHNYEGSLSFNLSYSNFDQGPSFSHWFSAE